MRKFFPGRVTDTATWHLAAIVTSTDDVIISKTLTGLITSWNPAAEEILGYTEEEMIGESILRIIPREYQHEENVILQRIRTGQRVEHYETVRKRKDGKHIPVSLTISPVRNNNGQIIGASKILRVLSGRERTASTSWPNFLKSTDVTRK